MTAQAESTQEKSITITINLEHSDSNRKVKLDELIQRASYEKLKKEINLDLRRTDGEGENYPASSGLVYFIDGTRGAGKSTFLQFVYGMLPEHLNTDQKKKVSQLDYIDPSRVENSEIILLSVLKALKRRVDEKIQASCKLDDEMHIANFRNIFKKLAGGLSLFAPSHNQLQDLDAELFLDWGLERAGHSVDLRKYLHQLIKTACQMLNVQALILAFDDADTNSEHAHNVLECIRKYLDTPQLVILVTGDMELYSLLIRDNFYDSLGKSKYTQEKEREEQRTRMVDHLEEQYLLKLFPISRRVQLRPLWNLLELSPKINDMSFQYELKSNNWEKSRNPNGALEELIRRGLRLKSSLDITLYREFLLKQPLRSVLQVLSRCAKYLSINDASGKDRNVWDPELSDALSDSLRAMALGGLYKFGIDVDGIGAHELPALIEAVFELAVRDGDMDTAAYLRPQPSVPALKNSFAALSADVANLCANKPNSLIQYLLAGPGSVSLYGQVQRKNGDSRAEEKDNQRLHNQFKQYMGIGRKEDALNWARHATAIFTATYAANPKVAVVSFGVIGLNKRKPGGVSEKDVGIYKTAKSAINACIIANKSLPVFALSLVDVSGLSSRTYASIYNILGLIERLLSLDINHPRKNEILNVLSKPYPSVSISRPIWAGESATIEEDFDDTTVDAVTKNVVLEEEESIDPKLSELCNAVERWLNDTDSLRLKQTPSAVMIGKIWTRLYFSLEKVSDQLRGKALTAGMMELFALCVINSFLVEEQDHHLGNSDVAASMEQTLDRSNPLTSPLSFIKKLGRISLNRETLPLTSLVTTCPLILGLLNSEIGYAEQIIKLTNGLAKDDVSKMLCPKNAWTLIDNTYIAGWKWGGGNGAVNKKRGPAKSTISATSQVSQESPTTLEKPTKI